MQAAKVVPTQLDYTCTADSGQISSQGNYFWMYYGGELEVFRVSNGTRLAKWSFLDSDGNPFTISCTTEVTIKRKVYLLVGLVKSNGTGQLRILDPTNARTIRTIRLHKYAPFTVESLDSVSSIPFSDQIQFYAPVVVGSINGSLLILDLHFAEGTPRSIVEGEQLPTAQFNSRNDLNKSWNHPFFILTSPHASSGLPITTIKCTLLEPGGILFVGNQRGAVDVWSLDTLELLGSEKPHVKSQKQPVTQFTVTENSSSQKLVIAFGPLDESRASIIGSSMKGVSDISLYMMDWEGERFLLHFGYQRSLKGNEQEKRSSRILFSHMLPSNGETEQCLIVWKAWRASNTSELSMVLLHLDRVRMNANDVEERNWFTSFSFDHPGHYVTAMLAKNSHRNFFSSPRDSVLARLCDNIPQEAPTDIFSQSFDMLIGKRGSISLYSFHSAQRRALQHIAANIRDLTSQAELKMQLTECISAGLLSKITENEALFNLFDLLLHQNMLCILCKHITSALRLEPIAEWILRKCEILSSIVRDIRKASSSSSPSFDLITTANNASMAISNFSILLNSLLFETSRLRPSDPKIAKLQQSFLQLEIEAQYIESWSWLNQNNLLGAHTETGDISEDAIILCLCVEARIEPAESYPPKDARSLLESLWENYTNPSDSHLLISKLKVMYYFLLEICIKSDNASLQTHKPFLDSFSQTFSQLLTPVQQKLVQGYWMLDNVDSSYSIQANASQYLDFDLHAISVLDLAYSYLCSPGVPLAWLGLIFKKFVEKDQNYATRFVQRDDFVLSKTFHAEILKHILLPNNLFLSLQFIRKQCKLTLEGDVEHLEFLMNTVFEYCVHSDCITSLFLLSLTHDEEELLVQFLSKDTVDDKRILFYLQRSQFSKAFQLGREKQQPHSYEHLLNNYKSVLPEILIKGGHFLRPAPASRSDPMEEENPSENIMMTPKRNYDFIKTPKTERFNAKVIQHHAFQAPTISTQMGNTFRKQPFTPYVIPKTPASRSRMQQPGSSTNSFAPFLRSSVRKTPRKVPTQQPQAIPFSDE